MRRKLVFSVFRIRSILLDDVLMTSRAAAVLLFRALRLEIGPEIASWRSST
jgi:hypothetical protein